MYLLAIGAQNDSLTMDSKSLSLFLENLFSNFYITIVKKNKNLLPFFVRRM